MALPNSSWKLLTTESIGCRETFGFLVEVRGFGGHWGVLGYVTSIWPPVFDATQNRKLLSEILHTIQSLSLIERKSLSLIELVGFFLAHMPVTCTL